jgi:hypothetical protein
MSVLVVFETEMIAEALRAATGKNGRIASSRRRW